MIYIKTCALLYTYVSAQLIQDNNMSYNLKKIHPNHKYIYNCNLEDIYFNNNPDQMP